MPKFNFFKANNIREALALIDEYQDKNYMLLAGGTDFIPKWKDGIIDPKTVIDISLVSEFKEIKKTADSIFIGAAATFGEILKSEIVSENLPALAKAASHVGSPQIRSRATIGGNSANASPAGDSIPALFVYEAAVVVVSKPGERKIPISDFFKGPGKTVLSKGEIIKGFELPPQGRDEKCGFVKLGQRSALAISKIMCAGVWKIENDSITRIKLAFGAVAPTVIRAEKTEKFLNGKKPSEEVFCEAAQIAEQEVKPITDIRSTAEYRREAAGVILKRLLSQ